MQASQIPIADNYKADPFKVASTTLLNARDVTLRYQTRDHIITATYRVSFDIRKSDRFVVLGPSGCGKSTLLKAVGGFIQPTEGRLSLNGREITKPGPDRMMVFQEFDQLLPWRTVKENIAYPLIATKKFGKKEAEDRALHYIAKVRLDRFSDSLPHTLSGGMKQRVAIARGMAMEPE